MAPARVRVFRRADQRRVPWKNGRGSTLEIAIHPAGATVADDFDWRVSMAAVVADGPFSDFPGIDRTLVLLAGAGADLVSTAGTRTWAGHHALVRFPGDVGCHARLHAGPVQDLGLMVRRAAFAHAAEVVAVHGTRALGAGRPLLAVVLDGQCTLAGHPLAATEAIAVDGALVAEGTGTLLVARLTPRG